MISRRDFVTTACSALAVGCLSTSAFAVAGALDVGTIDLSSGLARDKFQALVGQSFSVSTPKSGVIVLQLVELRDYPLNWRRAATENFHALLPGLAHAEAEREPRPARARLGRGRGAAATRARAIHVDERRPIGPSAAFSPDRRLAIKTKTILSMCGAALGLLALNNTALAVTNGELRTARGIRTSVCHLRFGRRPASRCSGTLISPTVMVTAVTAPTARAAAECGSSRTSARRRSGNDYPFGGGTEIELAEVHTHPQNLPGAFYAYDVGVVILSEPVVLKMMLSDYACCSDVPRHPRGRNSSSSTPGHAFATASATNRRCCRCYTERCVVGIKDEQIRSTWFVQQATGTRSQLEEKNSSGSD